MNLNHLMRQFTIRTRMLGAVAIVLVLLLAVGGSGLWGLYRVEAISARFLEHTYVDTLRADELRASLGDLRRYEKDLLINYEKPEEIQKYKLKWQQVRDAAAAQARQLAGSGNADQGERLAAQIAGHVAAYARDFEPVLRQLEASGYDSATVANRMAGKAKESAHLAEQRFVELKAFLSAEAKAATAQRQAQVANANWVLAAAIGLALLVVIPLTLLNMVMICRPIDEAQGFARAIAAGDLTRSVDSSGRDEPARLQASLNEMQQSLRRLIGDVRQSTDSIGTASSEIASGNADLSSRTEQAAGSLQQTASSMEQLTGTVRQTADSARTANQLASSAQSSAAKGGEVVAQVVSTMNEINASSKKIADIIGVIDGIAFQTNILALNAAVEAARAGEQGRGFAVVAGEVRSLAQRSAQAAKEIKDLIGASVGKVQTGSRLVADAGQAMGEIVGNVQRVSDIIGEITAAAAEQSDGIGQVNTAVTQLDQMTQQNAALVEQSAAAAESLKDQALRLAQSIAVFKVGAAEPAAAPARPAPAPAPAAKAAPPRATPPAAVRVAVRTAPAPKPPAKPPVAPAPPVLREAVVVASAATQPPGDDWQSF